MVQTKAITYLDILSCIASDTADQVMSSGPGTQLAK